MPKEIPDCPNKPHCAPPADRTYEIELITPMVGGGTAPGEVDQHFLIRPTAIRGHLRHWWRLIRGDSFGAGMWQREEEIFGSTEFPSPVTVSVLPLAEPALFDPSDNNLVDRFGPVAYALFASIENHHQAVREGLRFRLSVRIADETQLLRCRTAQNERRAKVGRPTLDPSISPIANEVDEALGAWLTFGGIGGRTRRGCGAIHCRAFVGSAPQLSAHIFVGSAQANALAAWKEALSIYREFRQTPRGDKHNKTLRNGRTVRVPGRSHWPEADSIRKLTGCSLKPPIGAPPSNVPADENTQDHSTPVAPEAVLPAFPKAVLGLPINFHFADGPEKREPPQVNRDPKDVQLYPVLPAANGRMEKAERMASPIITRPLWQDGKWLPAIIMLNQALPAGLQVRLEGRNASLSGDLQKDLPINHVIDQSLGAIAPMRGKPNAIEALIDFLHARSFREVTR